MGRLNVDILRYLSSEQMRVLTAVEMGMKNHEFVVDKLVKAISGLRCSDSSVLKMCRDLCQHRLLSHAEFGYRLTNAGYDCLALKALVNAGKLAGIGSQIGVGKESDVYLAQDCDGGNVCVKLHRLGRTSFRQLKNKRDYLGDRSHFNWLYISRLSAEREFSFLEALHSAGLPVPKPLGRNRHAVVMEFVVDAQPLNGLGADFPDPEALYDQCRAGLERLASLGLVHGDYNEFNLLVQEDQTDLAAPPVVRIIDLPQCVSRRHPHAEEQYDRDARCVVEFFRRKFGLQLEGREPALLGEVARDAGGVRIDERLRASGYQHQAVPEAEDAGSDGEASDGDDDEKKGDDDWEEVEGSESSASESSEPAAAEGGEAAAGGAGSSSRRRGKPPAPAQLDPESLARRRVRAERRRDLRRAGLRSGRRAAKREARVREGRDMREELNTWG